MPFELQVKTSFSAAHRLDGYIGDCKNLHGHNWNVEVFVTSEELGPVGFVIDFGELKKETDLLLSKLDHSVLNDQEVFKGKNPTSENIAFWLYKELKRKVKSGTTKVTRVKVWETDSYSATYSE